LGVASAATRREGEAVNSTYSPSSGDALAAFGSLAGGLILCWLLFIVLLVVGMIYVYYKIFEKTGNSGWLALLMFVPIANIAIILYLAFSDWPVIQEVRDLRARVGYGSTGYIPPVGTYAPSAPTYAQPTQPYAPTSPTAPMYAPPQPPVVVLHAVDDPLADTGTGEGVAA